MQSSIGEINISDNVIFTICNKAANEIEGINSTNSVISDMMGKQDFTKGVKINKNDMSVDLTIDAISDYGIKLNEVVELVQKNVKNQVETMCAITVNSVNVNIVGINVDAKKEVK